MAYITVRAIPGNVSKKGEVTNVRDDAVFGKSARLPKVLRIEVTGATAEQIKNFLTRLKGFVEYSIVNETVEGWRVKMEVSPAVVAATGMDAEFKQSIKDYILNDPHEGNWTATQVSQGSNQLTVDIAKGQAFDLAAIKEDVTNWYKDKLEDTLHFRQYYFPDAIVDPRVTQGVIDEAANENGEGNLPVDWIHDTITKAQAQAVIVDRLA